MATGIKLDNCRNSNVERAKVKGYDNGIVIKDGDNCNVIDPEVVLTARQIDSKIKLLVDFCEKIIGNECVDSRSRTIIQGKVAQIKAELDQEPRERDYSLIGTCVKKIRSIFDAAIKSVNGVLSVTDSLSNMLEESSSIIMAIENMLK